VGWEVRVVKRVSVVGEPSAMGPKKSNPKDMLDAGKRKVGIPLFPSLMMESLTYM
jgi:hypothetical protein